MVLKQAREEVVDLPGHVQDVAHPAGQTVRAGLTCQTFRGVIGSGMSRVTGFSPLEADLRGGNAMLMNITEAAVTLLALPIKSHGQEGFKCSVI